MRLIRSRPRSISVGIGLLAYITVGLAFTDLDAVEVSAEMPCAIPILAARLDDRGRDGEPAGQLTILQGNFWMLPTRPLIVPYAFSTDREERLTRLVALVRACRPAVVTLQEVFDIRILEALAESLPEYVVHTSGITDARGSINTSGLATLTRVPAHPRAFETFEAPPAGAQLFERLGRKGFLAVDVAVPGNHVTVVNTHLYASRDTAEARITRAQLREVLGFVAREEAGGAKVLLSGDFNIERDVLARELAAWAFSAHGPTYDPIRNPYTVQGANDTDPNHQDRSAGRGTRTVDFLMVRPGSAGALTSVVLHEPKLSDHQFLAHVVEHVTDSRSAQPVADEPRRRSAHRAGDAAGAKRPPRVRADPPHAAPWR